MNSLFLSLALDNSMNNSSTQNLAIPGFDVSISRNRSFSLRNEIKKNAAMSLPPYSFMVTGCLADLPSNWKRLPMGNVSAL